MIGLDTNVLVRFLTRDDPQQSRRATEFIEKSVAAGEQLYVNHVVLCELVWVLESAYEVTRAEIADTLEALLRASHLSFQAKDEAWAALGQYRQGKADFADYLIGAVNEASQCVETVTFDRLLARTPGYRLL